MVVISRSFFANKMHKKKTSTRCIGCTWFFTIQQHFFIKAYKNDMALVVDKKCINLKDECNNVMQISNDVYVVE